MQSGDLWQHKLDDGSFLLIVDYESSIDEATVFKFNSFSFNSCFLASGKHINLFWRKIA